jgi:hypothetical protein
VKIIVIIFGLLIFAFGLMLANQIRAAATNTIEYIVPLSICFIGLIIAIFASRRK